MKNIRPVAVMLVLTQVLFACANHSTYRHKKSDPNNSARVQEEIIYKLKNGQLIDVFNITESVVSHEDNEYLSRRDYNYGEFGGQIEFCSNNEYHCLRGALFIAFPKDIGERKKWQFEGRNCQVDAIKPDQQLTIIICNFKGYSTRFSYSLIKGIISYVESSDPAKEYELMG
jgi:hypothetical protein